MKRRIIHIDESRCNGCGLCAAACHEGAIEMVDGKARLTREDYCDGLGDCLPACPAGEIPSQLRQWPVQIKLAPVNAPYFDGCHLLIAADCTAYAYGNFHRDFIRGKVTLIGCPKLDEGDYTEKLTAILAGNDVKSVTVARMTVPCCGGIQRAAEAAVSASGKQIPLHVAVISPDGAVTART